MEIVNNIYQYKDPIKIKTNLEKLVHKNDIREILSCIYNNERDIEKILHHITNAVKILEDNKYNIEELTNGAHDVLSKLTSLKTKTNIYIAAGELNDSLYDFEHVYNKFVDPNFCVLLNKAKNISKLIHLCISSSSQNFEHMSKLIRQEINEIYNLNADAAVQLIANKSQYIIKLDKTLYEYCWSLVKKSYDNNPANTLHILLIELRKIYIENIKDPALKKFIYFNVDIEEIKNTIEKGDLDSIIIKKSIEYLSSIVNVQPNNNNYYNSIYTLYTSCPETT